MNAQTVNATLAVNKAHEADAKRFCRVVKQVAGATFAGLARPGTGVERLYDAGGETQVFQGTGLSARFVTRPAKIVLSASAAGDLLQDHPWRAQCGSAEWIMFYPVGFSEQAPPAVIVAAGRGAPPPADVLDDMAGMLRRDLRHYTELTLRRDDSTRYQLLARATNDVIWDWDVVLGRMDYNENLERVLGISPEDIQADPLRWFSYIHPDDRERIYRAAMDALDSGIETWEGEYRLRRGDGEYALILEKISISRNDTGKAVRMIGSITDVTAARAAEAELKAARHDLESALHRLRQIMDESADMIVTFHRDGSLDEVSSAVERILGYTAEQLKDMPPSEVVDPDDLEPSQCALDLVLETGHLHHFRNRLRRRDGSVVHMQWSVAWSGEQQMGFAVGRDVTEAVHALDRLSESEEQYRLVFMENPVPMSVYDENTLEFLDVNQAMVTKYGYTRDELLGLRITEVVNPEDRDAAARRIALTRGGGPRAAEWRHQTKNGERIIVQGWSHPVTVQGRNARLVVALDLTERRALEEQLRQAQKMEAVGQLAGGIAHDFNNLLTIINGYASLLRQRTYVDESIVDYIDAIEEAGKRAAVLTQQLLAFSRKQVLQPTMLDLNAVLSSSEPILRRLVRENIAITLVYDPELLSIRADSAQIEQVVMNLVVNARDAMPAGGRLLIETRNITIDQPYAATKSEVSPGAYVLLAVTDTGIGMDERVKQRIFEPFFTTKGPHAGHGLGLPTVYGIVKQSGGHIWVYSEQGKGTTMKVLFPVMSGAAPPLSSASPDVAGAVRGGTETILVVEDDAGVREFSTSVLAGFGYHVLSASDGEEALQLARSHQGEIDLLLTDVILPRMGGRALADALMPLRPKAKVLFVSGYTENAIVHHGVLDPGINYLAKPFDAAQLASKLRTILDEPLRRRSVVVVDDERAVREMFRAVLEDAGYDVRLADGPEEAVRLFQSAPVDLVLSDLNMPGRTCEQNFRLLRREFPHARMMCVSGAAGDVTDADARQWGAQRLLTKPVSPAALLEAVKDLIG